VPGLPAPALGASMVNDAMGPFDTQQAMLMLFHVLSNIFPNAAKQGKHPEGATDAVSC